MDSMCSGSRETIKCGFCGVEVDSITFPGHWNMHIPDRCPKASAMEFTDLSTVTALSQVEGMFFNVNEGLPCWRVGAGQIYLFDGSDGQRGGIDPEALLASIRSGGNKPSYSDGKRRPWPEDKKGGRYLDLAKVISLREVAHLKFRIYATFFPVEGYYSIEDFLCITWNKWTQGTGDSKLFERRESIISSYDYLDGIRRGHLVPCDDKAEFIHWPEDLLGRLPSLGSPASPATPKSTPKIDLSSVSDWKYLEGMRFNRMGMYGHYAVIGRKLYHSFGDGACMPVALDISLVNYGDMRPCDRGGLSEFYPLHLMGRKKWTRASFDLKNATIEQLEGLRFYEPAGELYKVYHGDIYSWNGQGACRKMENFQGVFLGHVQSGHIRPCDIKGIRLGWPTAMQGRTTSSAPPTPTARSSIAWPTPRNPARFWTVNNQRIYAESPGDTLFTQDYLVKKVEEAREAGRAAGIWAASGRAIMLDGVAARHADLPSNLYTKNPEAAIIAERDACANAASAGYEKSSGRVPLCGAGYYICGRQDAAAAIRNRG